LAAEAIDPRRIFAADGQWLCVSSNDSRIAVVVLGALGVLAVKKPLLFVVLAVI
jgi:hypothetical protein